MQKFFMLCSCVLMIACAGICCSMEHGFDTGDTAVNSDISKYVVMPDFGTTVSTYSGTGAQGGTYSRVTEEQAKAYIRKLEDKGFNNIISKSSSAYSLSVTATNENNIGVSVSYYAPGGLSVSFYRTK